MFDKAFHVYIITNKRNGTLYTGHTDDLGRRMDEHISGFYEGFSKRYALKSLVWFEAFETRDEAFTRERRIKAWKRKWKIELIEKFNPHWIDIVQATCWPPPDKDRFPDIWKRVMDCRLDPKSSLG